MWHSECLSGILQNVRYDNVPTMPDDISLFISTSLSQHCQASGRAAPGWLSENVLKGLWWAKGSLQCHVLICTLFKILFKRRWLGWVSQWHQWMFLNSDWVGCVCCVLCLRFSEVTFAQPVRILTEWRYKHLTALAFYVCFGPWNEILRRSTAQTELITVANDNTMAL